MKNEKKILIAIIILVICIILVTIALLMLRKETVLQEENPTTLAFENVEAINDKNLFFKIESNVETYMNYLTLGNQQAVSLVSPTGTVLLKQTGYTNFLTSEIYAIDKIDNMTLFIHEIARGNKIQDDYYMIMNLDYQNNTFQIIASSKEEFENAKNNRISEAYKEDIRILKNEYNAIEQANLTDFEILKKYFEDYKFKAINQPQIAFALIEPEYKAVKFNNNLEEYKVYIQNNGVLLQDANIVKHGITKQGQYGTYIFVDNNNNYYELVETGIYEYAIILDNYTLESDELKEKYSKLSNQEKALSNVDKVMKLINTKSYEAVYKYLNQDFKNSNFPNIDIFVQYIKQNFFDNNIVGNITITNKGDIYILTVPYKESLSSAAQQRQKTFMVRLGQGTNFELSFEI